MKKNTKKKIRQVGDDRERERDSPTAAKSGAKRGSLDRLFDSDIISRNGFVDSRSSTPADGGAGIRGTGRTERSANRVQPEPKIQEVKRKKKRKREREGNKCLKNMGLTTDHRCEMANKKKRRKNGS